MCGIAGLLSWERGADRTWIRRMTEAIRHRGPDDEGYLAVETATGRITPLAGPDSRVNDPQIDDYAGDANLWLGHRRLAVVDVSARGHQPMADRERTAWIVYNGEIYNFRELRGELTGLGHVFVSDTDTEVLLAAYRQWGRACLDRFDGMWSFVLYDARRKVLFGARDRFGVKPLYYYRDARRFMFASEVKALLAWRDVDWSIDPAVAWRYLALGADGADEGATLVRGIVELPGGAAFELGVTDADWRQWRYYELPWQDASEPWQPAVARAGIERTRELLDAAVRRHMMADVAVGSCLSGGLDSSAVVGTIAGLHRQKPIEPVGVALRTFTAVYPGLPIDEGARAETVATSVASAWHPVRPRAEEFAADLEDLVYCQDLPFGSTSIYAQYGVMRAAREVGVTVLLDGQGGDELFGGYPRFLGVFWAELWRQGHYGRLLRELSQLHHGPLGHRSWMVSVGRSLMARAPALIGRAAGRYALSAAYLDADLNRRFAPPVASPAGPSSLNGVLAAFMGRAHLAALLRYEDRNAMRFSIEARTPFADDRALIEHVFGLPSVYKIHDGRTKYLLREAVAGRIPEAVRLATHKIGFATPEVDWLRHVQGRLRDELSGTPAGFLQVDAILRDWDRLLARQQAGERVTLWRYLNFALWRRVFRL
jgi:asparagine synthase (glutamine-hydrolysing)